MDNSGPPITPSSEIIHLVSTFADSLDSLPPSLTRCLSDLKELDAVLSGALGSITAKLTLLSTMMATPPPGTSSTSADAPTYTPFDRLKLLREVTEDARIFRLGGEDKIRVATGTCETIATHTSHLSTLSTLLLSFLPSHMLPMLPPPSAPHGYPSSLTPSSALARRQIFDYPPSQHAGSGSTTRMSGALGMVREHWDMTRGRSGTKRRPAMLSGPLGMDDMGAGLRHDRERALKDMHKDPSVRHPNQYTKKRLQEQAAAAARVNHGASSGGLGGGLGVASGSSNTIYSSAPAHPFGMTAIDSVKSKRANENGGHIHSQSMHSQHGVNGNGNGGGSIGSNGERSGSISGASGGMLYAGMASQDEYNAATAGGGRTTKRKTDDAAAASKRRKTKAPDALMEPLDVSPLPSVTASKSRRTVGSTKLPLDAAPLPLPVAQQYIGEEQFEGEIDEDGDGQTYCICHRVSFGEMIGCDGTECEKEWFHLPCVGLSAIPKGRWFCDDCRKKAADKAKKRR